MGTTSPLKIYANIFISFIGAGVLGLPYAFKKAGLLEGVLIMVLVSYFSIKAMLLIIDCKYKVLNEYEYIGRNEARKQKISEKVKPDIGSNYVELKCSDDEEGSENISSENNNRNPRNRTRSRCSETVPYSTTVTYSDLGFAAFGVVGRTVIDVSLLTSQIGFCCAYLIFITENLSNTFPWVEKHKWLTGLLPLLFLLTLVKDLSRFAVFSLCAQVSNLFAFTIVYWFDFQHLHLAQVDPKEFSLEGLPYFFSVAIYCFEGAGMILSLEESVAQDVKAEFRSYFLKTVIAITILYITFGGAGYLSYGNETSDIITFNLPRASGFDFSLLVKSCLCFSLFFTYPIMLFPVFSLLEQKLDITGSLPGAAVRLFVVLLTGLIIVKVPNFGELMALVGASSCTLLAFIMPALCHLKLFRDEVDCGGRMLDYTLIVLGGCGSIVGTLDTLLNSKHINI